MDSEHEAMMKETLREQEENRKLDAEYEKKLTKKDKWKIVPFDGSGVHIDIKKHEIMHNKKRSFIRFETSQLIHCYLYPETGSSKTSESNALL